MKHEKEEKKPVQAVELIRDQSKRLKVETVESWIQKQGLDIKKNLGN